MFFIVLRFQIFVQGRQHRVLIKLLTENLHITNCKEKFNTYPLGHIKLTEECFKTEFEKKNLTLKQSSYLILSTALILTNEVHTRQDGCPASSHRYRWLTTCLPSLHSCLFCPLPYFLRSFGLPTLGMIG